MIRSPLNKLAIVAGALSMLLGAIVLVGWYWLHRDRLEDLVGERTQDLQQPNAELDQEKGDVRAERA
jgi:hypothetical protein